MIGSFSRCQIYNAIQAFCNSLSGLLASRGALETIFLHIIVPFAILAAYYFGTSLYPETKTFRYLADVFNDASTVLDTVALIASGSKAALTSHFPSPLTGKGDVGEVREKDTSQETVVELSGMLVRTGLRLFVLVGAHTLFYLAVRSVILRTLHR
ncbi:hypothetical protein OG21DRAFT_1476453 [Imleria badia]|nr:hypothetical protein OG21DRAFT_1476453 [Imleria badia]